MSKSPILLFDIETTHLKADFGTVLCVGYKWYEDRKPHIISIRDFNGWQRNVLDDKRVVEAFRDVMCQAGMWVTYFGKGFDCKVLNAKCLEHGLDVVPNTPHVDLFYIVKANLALSRKSLERVADYVGCVEKKTPVSGPVWKRAAVGDPEALSYVEDHCKADVLLLEEVYTKLRPYVRTHPRVAGYADANDRPVCAVCGGMLVRDKTRMSRTKGMRQQWRCPGCGAYETRTVERGG